MKIEYKFADSTTSIVEVEDTIGEVILESRRLEENRERKERYHSSYSMDGAEYEGEDFADTDTPEQILGRAELSEHLSQCLGQLSEIQCRRLLMLADGLSIREIARRENTTHRAVEKSIEGARKKILKFL